MNFPARPPAPCQLSEILVKGLGQRPVEVLAADDYLAVFDSEATVRAITPDQALLVQLGLRGVIITAPGKEVDFVSRFFAPKYGVPEDPVTGSAHCALAPYWANKLGKNILTAKQVSKRGGNITCEVKTDRVFLSGCAVMFMESEIFL
ncbi:PhzF family phenazine biosynthesis protein [Acidithiobacillus sulfurivorans]|uniref:PhzF family phenazine biosynthesis protein n=1 Tax=Acidithiobacillus sulfurivorans TaxID=1958756 RepID=UPI001D0170A6|nr:PhzF family phenazine biosynthesis protein [Acidithiobacillus sulfurivorans]